MKRFQKYAAMVMMAVTMCLAAGQAFATTKTLTVGTATGSKDTTVSLPISVDSVAEPLGGAAFTIIYNPQVFTFDGLAEVAKPISNATECGPEYTGCDAQTIGSKLFYQFNDMKNAANAPIGKVLVAAASAQALTTTTLFNAKFIIKGGNGTYPISLNRTMLNNPDAGYVASLIPVLVGMPATQPNAQGFYPTPQFDTTLVDGSISITAPTYSISGAVNYVTETGNVPANGSIVVLQQKIGATSNYAFLAETTVVNGVFSFTNRPAGTYKVIVRPADPLYYEPTPFPITDLAANQTGVDFNLQKATSHRGTVTVNGGAPPEKVRVRVSRSCPSQNDVVVGLFPVNSTGAFETAPLPPLSGDCTYKYDAVYGNATPKALVENQTTDWSLTLHAITGTISGVVGPQDVFIEAASPTTKLTMGTKITGNGTYTINNLLPGSDYVVSAVTADKPLQYYNNKAAFTELTPGDLVTAPGSGIDFNFTLTQQAMISGNVKLGGVNQAGVTVYALELTSYAMLSAQTNALGNYNLTAIPGTYELFTLLNNKVYWYGATSTSQLESESTQLTVVNGVNQTGIDFNVVVCNGAIKGSVTTLDNGVNLPVARALVSAFSTAGHGSALTGESGAYQISNLCPGDYQVVMDSLLADQSLQEKSATVTSDAEVTVNFVIDTGSDLSGKVQNSAGTGIGGAMLYLVDETTGLLVGGRMYYSKADGSYQIKDIPDDALYTLNVSHPDYTTTEVAHLNIVVDTTQDVTLYKGNAIYGSVKDSNDQSALAGALVVATTPGQDPAFGFTDAQGNYSIFGLDATKSYVVVASKRGYERAVLPGKFPTEVNEVSKGLLVDITLTKIAQTFTLTGTVSKECDSTAIANARVLVSYKPAGKPEFFKSTKTGTDGKYTLTDLPRANNYTLTVIPTGNLRPVTENAIDGSAGGTVTKNVAIACGSSISGVVTLGASASKVYVVLFDGGSGAYVDYVTLTTKNVDGNYAYEFRGLKTQNYKVVAVAAGNQTRWYDGQQTQANATLVAQGSTNINITLPANQ